MRSCDRKAFTLMETMLALSVLAAILAVASSLVLDTASQIRETRTLLAAQHLAEHQLALVRLQARQGKALEKVTEQEVSPGLPSADILEGVQCFLSVSDESPDRPGLQRVRVRVVWLPGWRPREFHLESLVAERMP